MERYNETPKAPRWISTEAGQWAWAALGDWRKIASAAMRVQDRRRLLDTAEELHQQSAERGQEMMLS